MTTRGTYRIPERYGAVWVRQSDGSEKEFRGGDVEELPVKQAEALGAEAVVEQSAPSTPATPATPATPPTPDPEVESLLALADAHGVDTGRSTTAAGIRKKLLAADIDPDDPPELGQ